MDRRGRSRASIGLFSALVFIGAQSLGLGSLKAAAETTDIQCLTAYPTPFDLVVVSDSADPEADLKGLLSPESGDGAQNNLSDYLKDLVKTADRFTTSRTEIGDWKPLPPDLFSGKQSQDSGAVFFLEEKADQEPNDSTGATGSPNQGTLPTISYLKEQAKDWIVLSGSPEQWLKEYSDARRSSGKIAISVSQQPGQISITSDLGDRGISESFDVTWESGTQQQRCSESVRAPMSVPVSGDGTLTLDMVDGLRIITYSCKASSCTETEDTRKPDASDDSADPPSATSTDPEEREPESSENVVPVGTSNGALFGSLLVGAVIGAAALFLLGRRQPQIFGAPPPPPEVTAVAPMSVPGLGAPRVDHLTAGRGPERTAPAGTNGTGARPSVTPRPSKPGWTSIVANDASIRLEDVGLARILPIDLPRGRSWGAITDRYVAMSGWTEKIDGKGEDAQPALRLHDSGRGLVAVFDGVGGAGAGVARRLSDGTELSGAFVSSRLVRATMESWTVGLVDRQRHVSDEAPERLAGLIREVLADEAAHQPQSSVGLKGSLTRQMPTTMAAIAFTESADGVDVDALWAGDSRAYALSPNAGLQVLTVDDTRDTDAMSLIRNDMPMANLISADQAFAIHRQHVRLAKPTVLVTATDGCFGYVLTPAHFEFLILQTMLDSPDVASWASALVTELDAVAGDDVSFSVCGFGFKSWQDLQTSFRERCSYLRSEHWDPFAGVSEDRERLEQMRDASWATYRAGYHALLQQGVPVQ